MSNSVGKGYEPASIGGLASMLSGALPYTAVHFYPNGCLLPDGGQDCDTACRDINQVMRNSETLRNCLSYPRIPTDASHAASSGIAVNDSARDVILSIRHCLSDYCTGTVDNCGQNSSNANY